MSSRVPEQSGVPLYWKTAFSIYALEDENASRRPPSCFALASLRSPAFNTFAEWIPGSCISPSLWRRPCQRPVMAGRWQVAAMDAAHIRAVCHLFSPLVQWLERSEQGTSTFQNPRLRADPLRVHPRRTAPRRNFGNPAEPWHERFKDRRGGEHGEEAAQNCAARPAPGRFLPPAWPRSPAQNEREAFVSRETQSLSRSGTPFESKFPGDPLQNGMGFHRYQDSGNEITEEKDLKDIWPVPPINVPKMRFWCHFYIIFAIRMLSRPQMV
eukprot:gene25476-biopygen7498